MVVTGLLFCAAAFVLLLFIHLAVVVLAAALMVVVGISSFKAAAKAKKPHCPRCRTLPAAR